MSKFTTGIWNSVKDPWLYVPATIGTGIGVYESMKPNVEGTPIELGGIGAITGIGTGLIAKSWWNHDTVGVPWLGRGYI